VIDSVVLSLSPHGVDRVGFGFTFDPLFGMLAAFIHVSSELGFVLNSARLLRRPTPRA
jgi:hypothetical protein